MATWKKKRKRTTGQRRRVGVVPKVAPPILPKEIPEVKVIDRRSSSLENDTSGTSATCEPVNLKPSYVRELEDKMSAMEAKFREKTAGLTEETRRAMERLSRESERCLEEEKGKLLIDFIDVLDDLDRAMGAVPAVAAETDPFYHGVALVRENFRKKLVRIGMEAYGQVGEPFDPAMHEAVQLQDVADPAMDGKVAAVWQSGFRAGGRVLRAAKVSVGRCEE